MGKFEDFTGKTFDRLTVLDRALTTANHNLTDKIALLREADLSTKDTKT